MKVLGIRGAHCNYFARWTGSTVAFALLLVPIALAETGTSPSAPAGQNLPDKKAQDLDAHRLELRGMQDTLDQSAEQRKKIEAEIASIRNDRAKLNAALLETTRRISETESKIGEAEARLSTMTGSEEAIRSSLAARRGLIAEVLASLQRMGRRPPPALLVAPEDMLQAIRTSMLLGAVLPEMRTNIEALASDLADLLKLRASIASERDGLAQDMVENRQDNERLSALIAARQEALSEAERALGAEHERANDLARQTANLKDLISRMESEEAAAARGAEAARKFDGDQKNLDPQLKRKLLAAPFKDPSRLAPAIGFSEARGLLPMPVSGTQLRGFGAADGYGGIEKGILLATRGAAVVAAPSDGWVVFAGPYRTYGQLLIINAGQGYYIVLAGMGRINVNPGQFVLAGEPVAIMGDGSAKTAAAIAIGANQPILYVEFRKDGAAIDPGPWWVKPELQKVRG